MATYTDFQTLIKSEPEAVKSMIETLHEEEDQSTEVLTRYDVKAKGYVPMNSLDDIIEVIQECGNRTEKMDSYWLTRTYKFDTDDGKFSFIAIGQSYRKDRSLCDEEMNDSAEMKKAAEASKSIDAWNKFFEGKDLEELKASLLKYKFPSLI